MPDDIRRQVAEESIGGVYRLQDIEGLGTQTIRNLRSIGVRDVDDVASKTVDELTRAKGVGKRTAQRMKQAVPEDNTSSTTGSVSAAGIPITVGDFRVPVEKHDKADATFDTSKNRGKLSDRHRTQEAANADKGQRAPITTDLDEWRANKDRLDFPGVDTPSDDPDVRPMDRVFLSPKDVVEDERDRIF